MTFLLEIAIGIFSYVLAKSIWDFVKIRARVQNQLPIVWLAEFCCALFALLALLAIMFGFLGWALYVIFTRGH